MRLRSTLARREPSESKRSSSTWLSASKRPALGVASSPPPTEPRPKSSELGPRDCVSVSVLKLSTLIRLVKKLFVRDEERNPRTVKGVPVREETDSGSAVSPLNAWVLGRNSRASS